MPPIPVPSIWHYLFLFCAYASALLCLFWALRRGGTEAALEVLVFVLFVIGYWVLESWATHAGNFYLYPEPILDPVPYWPGSSSFLQGGGFFDPKCPLLPHLPYMSLSVLLMEASLTYTAMWTARLLAPSRVLLWPFLAGLSVLAVDIFLDPVVSTALDCTTKKTMAGGAGLRLWEWYVHPGLGIEWFGIPLFNYAAWFCVPIAAVAFALLLRWGATLLRWLPPLNPVPIRPIDAALLALVGAAFALLFFLSPFGTSPLPYKVYVMAVVLAGSIAAAVAFRRSFVHTHPLAWPLVLPAVLFCLFSALALFLGGGLEVLAALFVGLACCLLCAAYWLSPYGRT